jgi:predicted membrane protein
MLFPFVLGHQITTLDRIGLFALLLGVSGAFVHGFGYAPEQPAWRLLFSPAAAWSLMLAGGLCLLL